MYRYIAIPLAIGFVLLSRPASRGDDKEGSLKPTNAGKINTAKDEDDPHLSSSGSALLYTVVTKGKADVWVSTRRTKAGAWPAGRVLPDLTGKADFRSVFLTPDGRYPQYLYFATNKDPVKSKRGDNFDLYFLIKQSPEADFTTETGLPFCTARDEMHPWLTPDGRTLFYSRKDKDGWKQCYAQRPGGGGQFGEGKEVGLPVGFHHATLMPTGKTMYLQGPLEKNRFGLFSSTYDGKAWSAPEPLTALNDPAAPTGDRSPNLSRDGTILYFSSDREGGKGGLDVWSIPTAELKKK